MDIWHGHTSVCGRCSMLSSQLQQLENKIMLNGALYARPWLDHVLSNHILHWPARFTQVHTQFGFRFSDLLRPMAVRVWEEIVQLRVRQIILIDWKEFKQLFISVTYTSAYIASTNYNNNHLRANVLDSRFAAILEYFRQCTQWNKWCKPCCTRPQNAICLADQRIDKYRLTFRQWRKGYRVAAHRPLS